jgi:hypothetical protein
MAEIHYHNEISNSLEKIVPVRWAAVKDQRERCEWYYKARWLGVEIRIFEDKGGRDWYATTSLFGEPLYRHGSDPHDALTSFVFALSSRLSHVLSEVEEQREKIL